MGIKNLACRDVSKIMGKRPREVESVVIKIGRNRRAALSTKASTLAMLGLRAMTAQVVVEQQDCIVDDDACQRDNPENRDER